MDGRLIWFMQTPGQRVGTVLLQTLFVGATVGSGVAGAIGGVELGDWVSDQVPEIQENPILDDLIQVLFGGTLAVVAARAFIAATLFVIRSRKRDYE